MPIQITQDTTDAENGQISVADYEKMKSTFVDNVTLASTYEEEQVVKKYSVAIMKDEFSDLIKHYAENPNRPIEAIQISFAVHPKNFTACNGENLSESLTVVVEAARIVTNEKQQTSLE